MASKRMPAAESEFLEKQLLLTCVPNNAASRYVKMVTRQNELMFKCIFQVVPTLALLWAENGGPEPVWLSQKAKALTPLPTSRPGQIKLLQIAMFSDSPTIWFSLHLWVCVRGGGD